MLDLWHLRFRSDRPILPHRSEISSKAIGLAFVHPKLNSKFLDCCVARTHKAREELSWKLECPTYGGHYVGDVRMPVDKVLVFWPCKHPRAKLGRSEALLKSLEGLSGNTLIDPAKPLH